MVDCTCTMCLIRSINEGPIYQMNDIDITISVNGIFMYTDWKIWYLFNFWRPSWILADILDTIIRPFWGTIKYHILLHQHDVWVFYRPHLTVNIKKTHFREIPKKSDRGSTHQAVKSKSYSISLAIISKYTLEIHIFQKNIVAICHPSPSGTDDPFWSIH